MSRSSWPLPVMPRVDLVRPTVLGELLAALADGRVPLAGGTDLLVRLGHGGVAPPPLVLVSGVAGLGELSLEPHAIRLGAGVSHGRVAGDPGVRRAASALAEAAAVVGSVQIRSVATVVGNLCNASPAADAVPALAVHAAVAEIVAAGGRRRSLPVAQLVTGPGQTALARGELVSAIVLEPLAIAEGSAYRRFTARASMDLAFVGVAVRIGLGPDGQVARAQVALGAVGPTVICADAAAASLVGGPPSPEAFAAAGRAAADAARPISDLRASAGYRRRLVAVLVADTLAVAAERAASNAG